jgi:hypothetical protein
MRVVRSCPACRVAGSGQADADRDSGASCCGGKRYRRSRKRAGGGLAEAGSRRSPGSPGKGEAQGSIRLGVSLIRCAERGTSGRVKAWKPRSIGPVRARFGGCGRSSRRNGMQVHRQGVMALGTFRKGKASKGVTNPRSAVGTKQGRPGSEGRKPSGG